MILVIGEVLIDIFPDYQRIGGAPFNFAFHLKKLGFPVRLISRIGNDRLGDEILSLADANGLDTADIQIDPGRPTGTVRVALDGQGVPRFDICQDVAYDYLDLSPEIVSGTRDAEMIYFGSLLQRTALGHQRVSEFLGQASSKKAIRFCDINLRPPHVSRHVLDRSLLHADLLKLNEDEADEIRQGYGGPADRQDLLPWLMKTFDLEGVVMTCGEQGSLAAWPGGVLRRPAANAKTIVDTVGAGDGFSAILAAGILRGLPWDTIVETASPICGGCLRNSRCRTPRRCVLRYLQTDPVLKIPGFDSRILTPNNFERTYRWPVTDPLFICSACMALFARTTWKWAGMRIPADR